MTSKRWARPPWLAALLALWLAGCALSPTQQAELDRAMRIRPDPALLKDEPGPESDRLPLQLALVIPANLPGGLTRLPLIPGDWIMRKRESAVAWQLETGLIVEQALMHVLSGAMGGELKALPSAPAPDAGYGATLEWSAVRFDYDEQLRVLVPLFWVGEFEARTRMVMQLSLLDAQGQQVWTRSYDDGLRTGIWVYPGGYAVRTGDPDWPAGIKQMAHDAAARLAQRVLADLREWHEGQRQKPRRL